MSQADLDALRDGYEAFNRRDLDGLIEFFDADSSWIPSSSVWGAGGAYHGHEGVAQLLADLERDWERFEALPREFREIDDLILVLGQVEAVAKGGGRQVASQTAWIWQMRDGKALLLQAYSDPEQALAALALSE
jgi:uncharacterized protein